MNGAEQKVAVAFKWKSKSLINHVSRHSAHTPSFLKTNVQGRAGCSPQFLHPTSSLRFTKLSAPSPEGRANLPNLSFDNVFHFTVLILMSYAVSLHFSFSFLINSLHHRERLRRDKEGKNVPGCSRSDRQASPHAGRRVYRWGESVYHDFSKFNRLNVMSIKGDKNFNTSICSGSASKPHNLTLGVERLSGCQKMCQVSICFIRCTFTILSEICPQSPQTFFIS